MTDWNPLGDKPGLDHIRVGEVEFKPGDRVRLWPLGRADIMDMALEGKTATIEAIEQDFEDRIYLAVTVDDDPGKDLGRDRKPGHRFFCGVEEVELLHQQQPVPYREGAGRSTDPGTQKGVPL
jgi:hypothetical protein